MYALSIAATIIPAVAALINAGPVSQACATQMDGQLTTFKPADFSCSGTTRRYYVAAVEEEWDHVPSGKHYTLCRMNPPHTEVRLG